MSLANITVIATAHVKMPSTPQMTLEKLIGLSVILDVTRGTKHPLSLLLQISCYYGLIRRYLFHGSNQVTMMHRGHEHLSSIACFLKGEKITEEVLIDD